MNRQESKKNKERKRKKIIIKKLNVPIVQRILVTSGRPVKQWNEYILLRV